MNMGKGLTDIIEHFIQHPNSISHVLNVPFIPKQNVESEKIRFLSRRHNIILKNKTRNKNDVNSNTIEDSVSRDP